MTSFNSWDAELVGGLSCLEMVLQEVKNGGGSAFPGDNVQLDIASACGILGTGLVLPA